MALQQGHGGPVLNPPPPREASDGSLAASTRDPTARKSERRGSMRGALLHLLSL
jgi:hypothetical protein